MKDQGLPLLSFFAAGAIAWGLYAATTAPWLTWAHDGADGGDLIAAAMTWGVPHPSGYPTYCLLGRAFALLPLGSIAHRFHLFSATMAALSTAMVCALAWRELGVETTEHHRPWVAGLAVLVALLWATSRTLWSQAIIAEVYAPLAAGLALSLLLALQPGTPRRWLGLGLVLGLSLGLHLTTVLLLPGLALLLWSRRGPRPARSALSLLAGLVMGLGVYGYLPLAARRDPPINWGDAQTWDGFWWTVGGAPYRSYLFGLPIEHLPERLAAWLALWCQQYTAPGMALALLGLAETWERQRSQALGQLLIVLAFSAYAIGYDTVDSYVYVLPAYLPAAIWLAVGSRSLSRWLARWLPLHLAMAGAAGALALLLGWGFAERLPALNLSQDRESREWVEDALATLPPGALLITGEDRHTFALDYAQWAEGRRRDLCVVDGELLPYRWYVEQLSRRCPSLARSGASPSLPALLAEQFGQRPIYLASPRPELGVHWRIERRGPLWLVAGPLAPF
ncbi:MAG: DUF2723 domain-containing protein [Chloroflexi bacterium]|nr:DUF2723 domain-containing protein [Chloroflexota bacterium]